MEEKGNQLHISNYFCSHESNEEKKEKKEHVQNVNSSIYLKLRHKHHSYIEWQFRECIAGSTHSPNKINTTANSP